MATFIPPKCPVCDCYCCATDITRDVMECPFHGEISGLAALQLKGVPKYEAIAYIRAEQALNETRMMVYWSMRGIDLMFDRIKFNRATG